MEECRHTVLPAPTPELLSALPGIGPLGDPRLWAGAARGSGVAVECHLLERGGERAFCSVYPLRLNLLTYSRAPLVAGPAVRPPLLGRRAGVLGLLPRDA